MKFFLLFISVLSFLLFPSSFAFTCNNVANSDDCTSMNGCSWNSLTSTCSGNYAPSCTIPSCYYVDPLSGSDSQDGTPLTPFKTLKPAFTALATKAGTIYVINSVASIEAELLSSTTITTNIVLRYNIS